jgi:hypothetical protein
MSFTTRVLPIGEGITPTPQTDIDAYYVTAVGDIPPGSIGSEGSSDDPHNVFPDTFVDMANEAQERIDKDPPPKKKSFFNFKKKKPEESEEMPEEVL